MRIVDYHFVPEELEGHNIFRLLDRPKGFSFVSDAFKERVEECGITGCDFHLVWDSESEEA